MSRGEISLKMLRCTNRLGRLPVGETYLYLTYLCGVEVVLHMLLGISWVRRKRVNLSSPDSNSLCPAGYDYMPENSPFPNPVYLVTFYPQFIFIFIDISSL